MHATNGPEGCSMSFIAFHLSHAKHLSLVSTHLHASPCSSASCILPSVAEHLVLCSLLVDSRLGLMLLLVHLVAYGVLGGAGTRAHRCIAVLGNTCRDIRCAVRD